MRFHRVSFIIFLIQTAIPLLTLPLSAHSMDPVQIKTVTLTFKTDAAYQRWLTQEQPHQRYAMIFSFTPTLAALRLLEGYSDAVDSLTFTNTAPMTDAHMQVIGKTLPSLTGLHLIDAPITDQGVEALGPLKGLTSLSLVGSRITNYAVRFIGRHFHRLRILNVNNTGIDGQAFASLIKLPSLHELHCVGVKLEIYHIAHITGIKPLRILHLHHKDIERYKGTIAQLNSTLDLVQPMAQMAQIEKEPSCEHSPL